MPLERAGVEFVAADLSQFMRDLGKGGDAIEKLGSRAEGTGSKFSILGSALTGMATAATTFALDAVVALGKGLVGLGASSIEVAADFQSMTVGLELAGAASKDVADSVGGYGEIALAVGGDTRLLGVSATGAAEALTGLLKSGLSLGDILGDVNDYMEEGAELGGALRASIDLAAATELDMVQASDLAAIALSTFGVTAMEAGMTTDEFITMAMNNLVMTADASVAEVSDLAEALRMVGPTASAMSIGIQDVNLMLGLLSTRGIAGSMAGTSLNRMLLDLGKTTPKATEMMQELGIVIYDQEGAMLPLVDIIGQFEMALGDATDAERDAALQAIFTAQGARAMNTLLAEGIEGWVGMADATANATTISAAAEARSQTFSGQMEALEGVMETLKIRIGTALLPVLTDLASSFSEFIDEYGPSLTAFFEAVGAGAKRLFEAISGVDWVAVWEGIAAGDLGTLADFIQNRLVPAFRFFGDWSKKNWPRIQAVILTAWRVIQDVIMTVSDIVVNEIWPDLRAAFQEIEGALAELGLDWGDVWEAVKKAVSVVAIAIGAILLALVGTITGIVRGIAGAIKAMIQVWRTGVEAIRGITEGLAEWFAGLMEFIKGILTLDFKRVVKGFGHMWKGMFKTVKNTVKLIMNAIIGPFKVVYKFIEGFIKGILGFFTKLKKRLVGGSIIVDMMKKIKEVFDDTFEKILKIVENVLGAMADFIEKTLNSIYSFIEKILNLMEKRFGGFAAAIQKIWEDLWDMVRDYLDSVKTALEGILDRLILALRTAWETFTAALESAWTVLWNNVKSAIDAASLALTEALSILIAVLKLAWETFTSDLLSSWETLWVNVQTALEIAWVLIVGAVETGLGNIISAIEGKLADFMQKGRDIANSIREGLVEAWTGVIDAIKAGIEGIKTTIMESLAKLREAGAMIAVGIMEGLKAAWHLITDAVKEKINLGTLNAAIFAVLEKIKEAGLRIIMYISSGLRAAWSTLTDAIKEKINLGTIRDAINAASSAIIAAGNRLIHWIKQGILNAWSAFVAWLRDLISSWFGGSEPTDVRSPFRRSNLEQSGGWIGKTLVESMAAGIRAATPMLQSQLEDIMSVRMAQPVMVGGAVFGGGASTTEYNYNLTTPTVMQPGGLRLEFQAMEMASR